MTDGGEDGVVEVAVAVGEIVAADSVADDGLNGGAASHLSFDLWGRPSFLLGCIDLELVIGRRIVAAVYPASAWSRSIVWPMSCSIAGITSAKVCPS